MAKRFARAVIPNDSVFRFEAALRQEGNGGLRIAIPAAIVRGLVHLHWEGRWLHVRLLEREPFKVAVRPHPTAVMFAIPKAARDGLQAGDQIALEIYAITGPRAPTRRRVRGRWRPATPLLSLPWLGGKRDGGR